MPRSGYGSIQDSQDFQTDPSKVAPAAGDVWGALFREASQVTLGRSLIDRYFAHNDKTGQMLNTEEANQEYGLQLDAKKIPQISDSMAEYLQRKQVQSILDRSSIEQGRPDILSTLGAGVAASLTDPAELAIDVFLPQVKIAQLGALSVRAGRLVRPTVAARFLQRAGSRTVLNNPFLAGAIEGTGSTLLASPFLVDNSKALGRQYGLEDAVTDVAVSGIAGSLLQGGLGMLTRGRRTNAHLDMLPIDRERAHTQATADFANGSPVEASRALDQNTTLETINQTRRDLTAEILKAEEGQRIYEAPVEDAQPVQEFDTVVDPFDFNTVKPLPRQLERSAPRYKDRVLTFESDLDKALYVIGKEGNKSKAHDKFFTYVQEQLPRLSDKEIRELAAQVRQDVVDQAKTGLDEIPRVSDKRIKGTERQVPRKAPVDDIPEQVLNNPEFQKHTTPLEKRLLYVTDPEGFRTELTLHVEGINAKVARLADMLALPKDDFLEVADQALALQNEVLSNVSALNEILPANAQINTAARTTQSGALRKDTLLRIGKAVNQLNETALSDTLDDAAKVSLLTKEFENLRKQLKDASKFLKQAETKGKATEGWMTRVQELTPQVQHVQTLLRALGETAEAPELSLGDYIMGALGGKVDEQLDALLKANPDLLDEPTYRVRKQVFDNVMRRLYDTEQYLKSADDLGGIRPSKFPENDSLLADLRQELSELGDTLDPDVFQEKLFEQVNADIQAKKALNIFDQEQLARFDAIEENFKNNVAKTEAVKKGALQAQICALGGIG